MSFLLETDSATKDVTSRTAIGARTATGDELVMARVNLTGLNTGAGTINLDYVLINSQGTVIANPKPSGDTTLHVLLGPFPLEAADTLTIYAQSTNANDTAIVATVDFYDASALDNINAQCDTAVTDGRAATVSAVFAGGDIDGYTLEESQKLQLAALVGVLAGADGTSITIQAADGSKTRITATVDAYGNRSVVVLDETG